MTTVRFYVLGEFKVMRDGEAISPSAWRSQQTRTVLKHLLARRGRVVPTDQLLEALWPDADPEAARGRLHVRMSQLRRALDADDPFAFVRTADGGYTFSADADCWIDAPAFEAEADRGRRCQEQGDLAEAISAYERARELYRGDFLEEDLYEDWAYTERERLRERLLTMLTELAECYAQRGRYRRAIARCRQVLAADPYREAVYVRLMVYHYHAGEQDRALRSYERCRQVLASDLGLEPLPATTALADQIRSATLGMREDGPRYPHPVYEGRLFEVPYSLGHTPFVGREREYAWLVEAWRRAEAGVIVVEGEAGVGKSRLVSEFLGYAAGEAEVVLRSRAGVDEGLPYATVVSALRPLLGRGKRGDSGDRESLSGDGEIPVVGLDRAIQAEQELDLAIGASMPQGCIPQDERNWDFGDLSAATLSALAPLFPEVREVQPDLPRLPEVSAEQEQERLRGAVERLVEARVPSGALLFVDDAHRADPASFDLLARLAGRLTVVLTCRSEETPPTHPLRRALRRLRREGRAAQLTLDPLSPGAVEALIRQLAQSDLPALVEAVVADTEGNAVFLVALLQHMFEEGALYVDASGRWAATSGVTVPLPPTVRGTIEARLQRLSREPRRVFDLAAVAGGEFDFDLLQHASGMDETRLLDVLDGLLDTGLVVEPRTTGRAEFSLAHDRYTEVAYETLPRVRRRRLHGQVAEALEATACDLVSAAPTVAHHFEQAGDGPRAFDWLVRAGGAASARYAHGEALAFYRRAVDLEAGLGGGPGAGLRARETGPVWAEMGRIAHHVARYADGARFYEEALARWQAVGDTVEEIRTRCSLAECFRELSEFERAADHASAALDTATALPDRPKLAARSHIVLANAMRSGQLAPVAEFRDHLEAALALARDSEAWALVGEATFWLGVVTVNTGDAVEALVYDREALACFRRTGQSGWEAIGLNNLAYHALLAGQADAALEAAEEGLALARRIGSRNTQGWLLSTLGEVQTHLGLLDAAQITLEEGLALVRRWGPPRLQPGFLADLARVARAQGRGETALVYLEEAMTLAVERAPQFVPRLRFYIAEMLAEEGDLARAEGQARQALEGARRKKQRIVEGCTWRVLGAIHAAAGRPTEAEAAFARSMETLEPLGNALECARTRAVWGRWLTSAGDPRAEKLIESAGQTFEECGAVLDLTLLGS